MSDTTSFVHTSADPFEITFILGGGNQEKFSELGVDATKDSPHQITFSTEDEKNFEKLYKEMDKILTNYRKPKRRAVFVTPRQVAFFRGKESVHLNHVKKVSMVENVFFNNRSAKDGTEMVEVAVIGEIPCINKFFSELLNSLLTFSMRENNIEIPPREFQPKGKKNGSASGSLPTAESGSDDDEPAPKAMSDKSHAKKKKTKVKVKEADEDHSD